ncbi:hypothetical protein H634G_10796 [Metarhizium anisopliae BRIP 53293]|uniref:Uncharacterized protein n=1 Tax=Metarhizium anisopliae BRIP 53293 TaxID=1291518 RepID=A0A0D9NMP7_METAN|nr:hypothetical protein H634G_10796 [Metarhizium anisopliae BRIP 53293]KJK87212.1 hypothetical protein H633G_08922 [Metarhizium anisopliae BRIP 53284]
MAATVTNIDWSPLQVASSILTSNSIEHVIIGEAALMRYGATSTFNPEFSIEICVRVVEESKAVDVLKSSKLFQDVPDHVITQSCYEGTTAHSRLQTVWSASQPRNIIILPRFTFFGGLLSFPPPPSSKHKGTQLLGLSEKDVAWIPWANPHHLFWTFIIRRIYHHDQLAALAAKRLFDTGEWWKRSEKKDGQQRKMVTLGTSAKRQKKDGN